MDQNQFTVAITQTIVSFLTGIAWPTAVLVVALLFRREIRGLIARIRRVKAFGTEWDLAELSAKPDVAVAKATAVIARAEAAAGRGLALDAVIVQPPLAERLAELVNSDPRAAVLAAFEQVEHELRARMRTVTDQPEDRSGYLLIDIALSANAISGESHRALRGLLVLRDLAADGLTEQMSRGKALDFLTLCDAVIYAIRNWQPPSQR